MIPLNYPTISIFDYTRVIKTIYSRQLIQGKYVEKCELELKEITDSKYALMTSSGTSALHLALLALGIKKDDEVIVPAFSFVATSNVVELVGATPIFVDVDSKDFNIDVSLIEQAITNKTKAVIAVHQFGNPADLKEIKNICVRNNIYLIEDAACALGAIIDTDMLVGSMGDVACFSFHPRKIVTSAEGGAITTNESAIFEYVLANRSHGFVSSKDQRELSFAGYNYRMSDIHAALLYGQLKKIKKFIIRRQILADYYYNFLNFTNIRLPQIQKNKKPTWQTMYILLKDKKTKNLVQSKLMQKGFYSATGAQFIPAEKFYLNFYNYNLKRFPEAKKAFDLGLAIPISDRYTKKIVKKISRIIKENS